MSENYMPLHKEALEVSEYITLSLEELKNRYYEMEFRLRDEETLPRQRDEIERIMSHLTFEISMKEE